VVQANPGFEDVFRTKADDQAAGSLQDVCCGLRFGQRRFPACEGGFVKFAGDRTVSSGMNLPLGLRPAFRTIGGMSDISL